MVGEERGERGGENGWRLEGGRALIRKGRKAEKKWETRTVFLRLRGRKSCLELQFPRIYLQK